MSITFDPEARKLGKVRLRSFDNGVIYISRDDKDAIAYLDEHMHRLKGQKAWRPKCCFPEHRNIRELSDRFGRHAYIIGKGQSADRLTAKHFPTKDPIIGINEAFIQMEDLELQNMVFGIRQDAASGVTMPARTATMIINPHVLAIYAKYPNTYVVNLKKDLGITHSCASIIVAIGFAKAMGVKTITMYGFDAYTVGSIEYSKMANCRNERGNNYTLVRQRKQFKFLDMEGLTIRWVLPDLENYLADV